MASLTSPRWRPLPAGFGAMLRSARLRAGLSQRGLAGATNVSRGQIQAVEEGRQPPSAVTAGRISEALRLDAWESAVVHAMAVDDGALRTRRGIPHARPGTSGNGRKAAERWA